MRRAAGGLAILGLLTLAASQAAGQSAPPGAPAQATAPDTAVDTVTLSRTDNTQAVDSADLRLVLTKQKREEHALVRRLIFIIASLRLTEPAAVVGGGPAPQTCRWQYRSFLQRQLCFTSVTGLLACTEPEVMPLPDESHGEAAAPANAAVGFCNDVFRPVANARIRLTNLLHDRSADLFAADQKAKVDPVFKAAGVIARTEAAAPAKR